MLRNEAKKGAPDKAMHSSASNLMIDLYFLLIVQCLNVALVFISLSNMVVWCSS